MALVRSAGRHMLGIAFTTAVAGLATGAYSAFHFNHIEPYSMIGNLGALPLVSFVIMPAALLALVLMPFGLDGPALWVMGQGIDVMLRVAHFVGELEGSEGLVGDAPLAALVAVTFGGLWLALWKGQWRWGSLAPIALGLLLWGSGQPPDLLIDRDGRLVAYRGSDGRLMLSASRSSYAAETWLRHDGDARSPKEAAQSQFKFCDAVGCVWREEGRPVVAMPSSLAALADDCRQADIIVAGFGLPYRLKRQCKARLVIDRFDLWRDGAVAITFLDEISGAANGVNWRRETTRALRGQRPWVRDPAAGRSGKDQ
jgi:competence protein ComEC